MFDIEGQLNGNNVYTTNKFRLPSPLNVAAYNGNLVKVKYCVEVLHIDPLLRNSYGYTAIHVAADGGQMEVFKYLQEWLDVRDLTVMTTGGPSIIHIAALNGNLSLVKYLVDELEIDPLLTDSQRKTPLHNACRNGNVNVVRYLIDQAKQHDTLDAILGDKTKLGSTVLNFAAASGNCQLLKYLISDFNLDPNATGQLGATPLLFAAQEGHYHTVSYLTSLKININSTLEKTRQNVLHIAAAKGHLAIVMFLINEKTFNPDVKDSAGRSPLHLSAQYGSLSVIKFLVESCKCNFLYPTKKRRTPLHIAALGGYLDIVKYFIEEKEVEPLLHSVSPITPLHLAVQRGRTDVVLYYLDTLKFRIDLPGNYRVAEKLLLIAVEYGYFTITKAFLSHLNWTQKKSGFRQTQLLTKAAEKGHLSILRYLLVECQWEVHHSNPMNLLYWATINGHLNVLQFFVAELSYDPKILPAPKTRLTLLHIACSRGHLHIVEYLVSECGVNCSPLDRGGFTPLHHAAYNGKKDIVEYLLKQCDSVDPLCGLDGIGTPLHFAVANGMLDVAKYLIFKKNISPNVTNKNGATPLHSACSTGNEELVSFLLDQPECNIVAYNANEQSPIMFAILQGHLKVVELMIKKINLLVDYKNTGDNILHYAATIGNLEFVKCITSVIETCGAFINFLSPNKRGITPLHMACLQGHLQVVDYLTSNEKIDFSSSVDSKNRTPLHYAVKGGSLLVVKFLVQEKSQDPLLADSDGNTSIHIATYSDHLEILQWFFSELNLDPNLRTLNKTGLTCFHIACSMGKEAIAQYLLGLPNCDTTIPNLIGLNGLQIAIADHQVNIVKLIISAYIGKQINIRSLCPVPQGGNILHFSCLKGNLAIAKYLFKKIKKDFTLMKNVYGWNPLHYAVQGNKVDIVDHLISINPKSKLSVDMKGNNILHIAANFDHVAIAIHMIEKLSVSPSHKIHPDTLHFILHV